MIDLSKKIFTFIFDLMSIYLINIMIVLIIVKFDLLFFLNEPVRLVRDVQPFVLGAAFPGQETVGAG